MSEPVEIPYPPVFHDWRPGYGRVATSMSAGGSVGVEMHNANDPRGMWHRVELTEEDAALLAASLLLRLGYKKLSRRVLRRVRRERDRA